MPQYTVGIAQNLYDMAFNLDAVICELQRSRPIFHREADLQQEFARVVSVLQQKARVRLETPLPQESDLSRLDVLIEDDSEIVAVELKYKTRSMIHQAAGESFNLKAQGAQDYGRHDFIKDVTRVERFVDANPGAIGYALLLTNDPLYWREALRSTNDAEFRLHHGRLLKGTVTWGPSAGAGSTAGRETPLALRGEYALDWRDYSALDGHAFSQFRYLVVKVTDAVAT